MAKETIVRLTDDIDGSEAAESVVFGFRGVEYEIDLSEKNLRGMEKAFAKWIDHGRVAVIDGTAGAAAVAVEPARAPAPAPARARRSTGTSTRARRTTATKAAAKDPAAIREWAKANGFNVSSRGRISSEVQQAFEAANR